MLCEQEQDNNSTQDNSLQLWAYQLQKILVNFSPLVELSFSENMLCHKMLLYSISEKLKCAYTFWNNKNENEFVMTAYNKILKNNFFWFFFFFYE